MGLFGLDLFTSRSSSSQTTQTTTNQTDSSVSGAGAIGAGAVSAPGGYVSGVTLSGQGASLTVNPLSQGVLDVVNKALESGTKTAVAAQSNAATLAAGAQAESVSTKTGGLSSWLPWIIGGVVALAGLFFIFGKGK